MAALKLQVKTKAGWQTLFSRAAGDWNDQHLHDLENGVSELAYFANPVRGTAFRLLDGPSPIRVWSRDTYWTTPVPKGG